jgi:hypothetical protein
MSEETTTTNEETSSTTEMSNIQKIIGIFSAPRQTFEAIDMHPTWFLPFVIGVVFFLVFQFLTMDIQTDYRLEVMDARGDIPQEQMDMARSQMQGPVKYIGFIAGPIVMLIMLVIISALFYVAGNLMIGGDTSFKHIFAVVNWTGLIGVISLIIMTLLILSKGTMHGVALDLSILLDTPAVGEEKSVLFRILSKFDIFVIWQIVVYIIGISVAYKTTVQKAAVPILTLWGIWIIISVAFGGFFERFGM